MVVRRHFGALRGLLVPLVVLATAGCATPSEPVSAPHTPPVNTRLEPSEDPPSFRCLSQQDCAPGEQCVVSASRGARCQPAVEPVAAVGPGGRPAPPLGLLDGVDLHGPIH